MNTRVSNALDLLKNGGAYQIGDIYLRMKDEKTLLIFGKTNYSKLIFLTKEKDLEEIKEVKSIFRSIVENSIDFNDFIKKKNLEYILMDSLNKGAEVICSEQNGIITWFVNINS